MATAKANAKNKKKFINDLLPANPGKTLGEKVHNLFRGQNSFLWFSFWIPVVIMYLIYLAMQIHPFGNGSVLVLDLNAQYVSFYEALREFVYGDTSLLYSFSRQLGGEFMGIYAYYIASPFSYIVALFPKERILEALLTIFLLKTGLCGFTCGFYLNRITAPEKRNKINVVIFSTMYALCSYAVVQQSNSMWIDALIWLPLLSYGIEELIKHRKFKLYVVTLALTVMSNYYIGYMVFIYVVLYFFYYFIAKSENKENNPIGEKSHFAKTLLRIIIFSIIAIGISALLIFTAYYSLTFGKNTFDPPEWKLEIKFDLMEYLVKFLPGSYDTVRRSGLPFVYCGVLTLFMLPIYFISAKVSNREKIMSVAMIAVFSLSFMISVVDLVWHGFQEPNWLNYRYSFMLSFLMIVMAYKGFNDMESVSNKVHLTTAAIIAFFLVFAQKYTFSSFNREEGAELDFFQTIGFTLLCLAVYLIMFSVYKKTDNKKSIGLLLTLLVCLEMFGNGISNVAGFGHDVIYTSYSSYNNYFKKIRPIVEQVKLKDSSFYRMETINHRKANDNMALGIKGLSNSTSTLNKETVYLLDQLGYTSAAQKTTYFGGNIVNDSLLGVRYLIASNEEYDDLTENGILTEMFKKYYIPFASDDNYTAYYNPYALSLAFAVSDGIEDFTFKSAAGKNEYPTSYHALNAVFSAMTGSEEEVLIFKEIEDVDMSFSNCDESYVSDKHIKYFPKDSSSVAYITYSFTTDRTGDVYFYLPSNYRRDVKLRLNGKDIDTEFSSDNNRGLLLGTFEAGEKISLRVKLEEDVLYLKNGVECFYYFEEETFKNCMSTLSNTQLVIDDEYSDHHITGVLDTSEPSKTIQTTIPYDEGWIIKVDGNEIDYYKSLNALIAFDIDEAGEHDIEFIYRPKVFVLGLTCSIAFTVIFILICVFEKPIYRFIDEKIYNDDNETEDEAETDTKDKIKQSE